LFPINGIVSEVYEKIRETCMPRAPFKLRYYSFPFYNTDISNIGEVPLSKVQTSRGFIALFEKISDGEPILTVFMLSARIYNTDVSVQYII
jgi:hypothetical protein